MRITRRTQAILKGAVCGAAAVFLALAPGGIAIAQQSDGSAVSAAAASGEAGDAAERGAAFLRQLQGSYRGRGVALIPGRPKEERVICQLTNQFEEEGSALVVEGECASTMGKTRVEGRLAQEGERVTGSLMNALKGSTMTRSRGVFSEDGALVVFSSFVNNSSGNLTRTRQVIRKEEAGFAADFYTFDNASGDYEPVGSIAFSAQ